MNKSVRERREYVGMPERGNGPIRRLKFKLVIFAALCALPLGGAATLLITGVSRVPLLIYLVTSVLAFGLYGYDKQRAKTGQWRIPEKILHGVELLGGWPGACVAQQLLRHKTRKVSFQIWFWLIVALHQAIWIDVLFLKMTLLDL